MVELCPKINKNNDSQLAETCQAVVVFVPFKFNGGGYRGGDKYLTISKITIASQLLSYLSRIISRFARNNSPKFFKRTPVLRGLSFLGNLEKLFATDWRFCCGRGN